MSSGLGRPRGDAHWMRRALALARPYLATCWPNPSVGACVVRDGRLLGEGVHRGPGQDHAEVAALRAVEEAGENSAGTTVYVTLEPCNHHGRTPPCSRALLDARVSRVVYAVDDSNPRAPGGGSEELRRGGVEVEGGLLAAVAAEMNHPFFETTSDQQAHWTLKLALGSDGTLAPGGVDLTDPEKRRITGPLAHRRSHRMRSQARAVLVGAGTVVADHPRLDVRHLPPEAFQGPGPRAVVLDPTRRCTAEELPPAALVLHGPGGRSPGVPEDGAQIEIELDGRGRMAWDRVESALVSRGLGLVLAEGGATVATSLLEARIPHRVHLFVSSRVWPEAARRLDLAGWLQRDYRRVRYRSIGPDIEQVFVRKDLPVLPGQVER